MQLNNNEHIHGHNYMCHYLVFGMFLYRLLCMSRVESVYFSSVIVFSKNCSGKGRQMTDCLTLFK